MTRTSWRLSLLSLLLAGSTVLAQSSGGKAARFYEDALRRYEKRDVDGAIIQLKNALQIDTTLLPVHVLLGRALLAKGDANNAELELSEALRLGVNRAEVVVPLAQTMVALGRQPQIFEQPRLALAGLPPAIQLQLLLVRAGALTDMGDLRGALKAIEDARAINPGEVGAWLTEVPLRIRARQFKEAAAAAEQAMKLAPNLAETHYQKGAILHVQGELPAALQAYEQALKLDTGHIEARLARAGILLDLGRIKETQVAVNELLQINPDDPRSIYLSALLAERNNDTAGAKAALKGVTELMDPVPIDVLRYRPQALMLTGMAHFGLGEYEKAKPYLEAAQRQQPNSALAKLLARIYLSDGSTDRATEVLENYLKSQPGDGHAIVMLASAHMSQGRYSRASNLMQEALRAKDSPQFRTGLGLSLLRNGQSLPAIEELERAYKADPKQAYAGLGLVTLYLRSGQFGKAATVADALVKSHPGNPITLMVQGMAKTRTGDFKQARASYEQAGKLAPSLVEPKLGLARLDIAMRSLDSAAKRLTEILRADESNIDALLEMASLSELQKRDDEVQRWLNKAVDRADQRETRPNIALVAWNLSKGQPSQALEAAKKLLSKAPEDVQTQLIYANAQLAAKDLPGARTTLNNAARRAAYDAPSLVDVAGLQLQAKDLGGAYYSLDKALSSAPDFLPAHVLMTSVELQQGDAAKAERRARQIIQAQPRRALGYSLLADVLQARGQTSAAIEAQRRAYELEPSSATLLRLFHRLAPMDGGKGAIDMAERWLKSKPDDAPVQKALGDTYARHGNFASARRVYETVLKQHPNDAEVLNNLANVLLRTKDPAALRYAELALAQAPRSALVIDTVGWVAYFAGDRDRALQLLRDARLREPNNPEIRYHLGVVLAQAGRKSEAVQELEAATKPGATYEGLQEARNLLSTLK